MAAPQHVQGDPWFEDGNIVLVTGALDTEEASIAFKVHRGVLARHSEVFRSMFEVPQSLTGDEILDGCPAITMPDLPSELSVLIKALYDGPCFPLFNRGIQDFLYATAILRLSTKYCIIHLRIEAIKYLTQVWPYTLSGHDRMVECALTAAPIDDLTYPFVHPLHVLHLARITDTRLIIPSALYFLSIYPLTDLLTQSHPKLKVESPSRMSSELTAQDLQDYTLFWQSRIELINNFVRSCCFERNVVGCASVHACAKAFVTMAAQLTKDWRTRTGPLHFILQAIDGLSYYPTICTNCRNGFRQNALMMRDSYWESLPGLVGLPSWEVLQEELDPASSRPSSATSPPSSPVSTSSSGGPPLGSPAH